MSIGQRKTGKPKARWKEEFGKAENVRNKNFAVYSYEYREMGATF